MSEIIDLDEFLGPDKQVRVAGKTYVLPPDLPAELYLQIVRFGREDHTEGEMIEALYAQLLELFQYKDPKLTQLPLTISQVVLAVGKIYGDAGKDDAPAPAPKAPTRGGRSSRNPKASS